MPTFYLIFISYFSFAWKSTAMHLQTQDIVHELLIIPHERMPIHQIQQYLPDSSLHYSS